MLELLSKVPVLNQLGPQVQLYVIAAIVAAMIGGLGKLLPKAKIAKAIAKASTVLNEGVIFVEKVLGWPVEKAGEKWSGVMIGFFGPKSAAKLEEGMFVTLAAWATEFLKLGQSFVNEVMKIVVNIPSRFMKGMLKDNKGPK